MAFGRQIEQIGAPDEVFHNPRTEFVMNFLGHVNLFGGRVEDGKVLFSTLAMDSPRHAQLPNQPVKVFVRPHDFEVDVAAAVVLRASLCAGLRLPRSFPGLRRWRAVTWRSFRVRGLVLRRCL